MIRSGGLVGRSKQQQDAGDDEGDDRDRGGDQDAENVLCSIPRRWGGFEVPGVLVEGVERHVPSRSLRGVEIVGVRMGGIGLVVYQVVEVPRGFALRHTRMLTPRPAGSLANSD